MHANTLLDAAKAALKLASDYALAKRLELPPQSIPGMRNGLPAFRTGDFLDLGGVASAHNL